MTGPLLSIGEFSARCRLSVRMLRHYDERGVLVPALVDAATGYRRYAVGQLADAADVRRLRDVGFGVAAMGALLAARGTPAYRASLVARRADLEADLAAAHDRLALLGVLLEGASMTITISRETLPALRAVGLRGTVPTYADEGRLWARLMPELAAQGVVPVGPCGVIEHDPAYVESDPDESVWVPVVPGTPAAAPLEAFDLPARDAVVARVVGPYSLISEAHARIEEYLSEHGLRAARFAADGPPPVAALVCNRYLTDPATTPPEANVTEVCVPVA